MPWCPRCKSEYREGFTVCVDCGSKLVGKEQLEELEAEQRKAKMPADAEMQAVEEIERAPSPLYQDSSERASENRSAAGVMLVMGSLGLLVTGLGVFGVIPLRLGNPYLTYGVMTSVFLLFLVAGVVSVKNARIFEKKAESENSLRSTLLEWCKESLHEEEVDRQIGAEEITAEEILYIKRFECVKAKLNHQFVNLDQGFLENFIENCVYDMVFEEKEDEKA